MYLLTSITLTTLFTISLSRQPISQKQTTVLCSRGDSYFINRCLKEIGYPLMRKKIKRTKFVNNFHRFDCEKILKDENKNHGSKFFEYQQCKKCLKPFSQNVQSTGHCQLKFHTADDDDDFQLEVHGANTDKVGFIARNSNGFSKCVCNSDNCDQKVYRNVLYDLMVDSWDKQKEKSRIQKFDEWTVSKIDEHLKIQCGEHQKIKWSKLMIADIIMSISMVLASVLILSIEFFGYIPSKNRAAERLNRHKLKTELKHGEINQDQYDRQLLEPGIRKWKPTDIFILHEIDIWREKGRQLFDQTFNVRQFGEE